MKSEVDFGDVQGIVRFGYGRLKGASYALARIKNLEAARSWLLSAPVATAVERDPPPSDRAATRLYRRRTQGVARARRSDWSLFPRVCLRNDSREPLTQVRRLGSQFAIELDLGIRRQGSSSPGDVLCAIGGPRRLQRKQHRSGLERCVRGDLALHR